MRRRLGCSFALVALTATGAAGYETDQYSQRLTPIADAVGRLNAKVNEALVEIAADWDRGADRRAFARAVYVRLGGRHWVDRLERWAIRHPEIAKTSPSRRRSIYRGLPFWATRINFLFGVGPTIEVAGVRIGTDKLGHFLSQGWKYHKRHLRGLPEATVVRLGRRNEASIFGGPATGSYSNADLVANYEGYRFYRSLFEGGIVGAKGPIVEWTAGGGARIARRFDFADHVNDYWDEALNPNRYDRLLRGPMARRLRTLCPQFERAPERFVADDDDALRARYAWLGMRDGSRHRLDRICAPDGAGGRQAAAR